MKSGLKVIRNSCSVRFIHWCFGSMMAKLNETLVMTRNQFLHSIAYSMKYLDAAGQSRLVFDVEYWLVV